MQLPITNCCAFRCGVSAAFGPINQDLSVFSFTFNLEQRFDNANTCGGQNMRTGSWHHGKQSICVCSGALNGF